MYNSSISLPSVLTVPRPASGSGSYFSRVMAFTSATMRLACGSTIWAPSLKYALKPLSCDGLWLAVMTAPASARNWRTA
jgi:hypothetical protein